MRDPQTNQPYIETSITGKGLLTTPQLNKGTAFTREERLAFGLLGKLPYRIETLDEQVDRAYLQYQAYKDLLKKNIYLNNLHDKNQILFYKLLNRHLSEILPVIYTPIVGTAVKQFSREYRQPRGLYISYNDREHLDEIFQNRSNPEIDLMVITDGEGVLGIGDQGIGGMDIPVAKLMVYSLCGGIDPTRTLPIFIDVGTNNETLLKDPLYLGLQHPRIERAEYDLFIDQIVKKIHYYFPKAFLHWEDFGRDNARRILDKYQDELSTFNDDIQGTGAVTLAALLAACDVTQTPLEKQRIIVFGAGTAGTGIADQIVDAMVKHGLTPKDAYHQFWLIDRQGLLIKQDPHLTEAQAPYAREEYEGIVAPRTLLETIQKVKPTVLIGCSTQLGAFNQEVVEAMMLHCDQPIIFPLSNPDEKCEGKPVDLLTFSKGRALIATGTPFPEAIYNDKVIITAQCNNALVFPGIGLGILAVKSSRLTKTMLLAASEALCQLSPSKMNNELPLLPSVNEAQHIAKHIAHAVAEVAIQENMAEFKPKIPLDQHIESLFWEPAYLPFRRKMQEK